MNAYLDLLQKIREVGTDREGRNGKTRALWALQFRHDMAEGFPLLTTKKMAFKAIVSELLWFLRGSTSDNELATLNGTDKTIWTANAQDPKWKSKTVSEGGPRYNGDLGRIYGAQWRDWQSPDPAGGILHVDQIATLVKGLCTDPYSRRHVITAWNPGELYRMALPPCHSLSCQFNVVPEGPHHQLLSLHMTQRSCDFFLGVPFNIASYALLLEIIARAAGMISDELVITFNDAHIYHAHFDAVDEQLKRDPLPLCDLDVSYNPIAECRMPWDYHPEDFRLLNYTSHPAIKAEMIV